MSNKYLNGDPEGKKRYASWTYWSHLTPLTHTHKKSMWWYQGKFLARQCPPQSSKAYWEGVVWMEPIITHYYYSNIVTVHFITLVIQILYLYSIYILKWEWSRFPGCIDIRRRRGVGWDLKLKKINMNIIQATQSAQLHCVFRQYNQKFTPRKL